MERVTANRNFTNKLWNAGKFITFNTDKLGEPEWEALQGADFSTPHALAALPLAERWIVSLLHQVKAGGGGGSAGRLLWGSGCGVKG